MPTDQEINSFLAEKCRFKIISDNREGTNYMVDPESNPCDPPNFLDPGTGMGLLFKYAVPELQKKGLELRFYGGKLGDNFCAMFVNNGIIVPIVDDPDPTRALAIACYKAFGGK